MYQHHQFWTGCLAVKSSSLRRLWGPAAFFCFCFVRFCESHRESHQCIPVFLSLKTCSGGQRCYCRWWCRDVATFTCGDLIHSYWTSNLNFFFGSRSSLEPLWVQWVLLEDPWNRTCNWWVLTSEILRSVSRYCHIENVSNVSMLWNVWNINIVLASPLAFPTLTCSNTKTETSTMCSSGYP